MKFMRLTVLIALQAYGAYATTLTGTVKTPLGSGVATGTIVLTGPLGVVLTPACGSGTSSGYTVPQVRTTVTSGVLGVSSVIGNDCFTPNATAYAVTFVDSSGNTFTGQWHITGTTLDVGTLRLGNAVPIQGMPTGNQTISQPNGTKLYVNSIDIAACTGTGCGSGTASATQLICNGGGTANVVTCPGIPAPSTYGAADTGYISGTFIAGTSSTAAMTLNVNSLGAKSVRINGVATSGSVVVVSGGIYPLYYDGTYINLYGAPLPITSSDIAAQNKRPACLVSNDTQSATALAAINFSGNCIIPAAATIVEVDVTGGTYSSGSPTFTGTSSIQIGKVGASSSTTLLSGALATVSGKACALTTISSTCIFDGLTSSGTITITGTALDQGDFLYVNTSASTADGVQTWYTVEVIYTIN